MGAITETVDGMISYTQQDWQKGHHAKVISYLKTCDIKSYVDLGANLGEVCNILRYFLPELTDAYLFEPQLDNFAFLQDRYKDNPKIKCFNYGIYYGMTELPLYRRDKNIGGYSVNNAHETCKLVGETIILKTLEEANIPVVDFVKIDVEGSEENIIKNSTYLKKVKYLEIEFHDDLRNLETVARLCKECFPNHKVLFYDPENAFLEKTSNGLTFKI
jgi:FkbM family methyltransferase